MLSRQECVAASDPVTMQAAESADSDVVHEVTVKLDEGGAPEAWAGLKPPGQVRSLDALHHMLHEASVLSSHLRSYKPAVDTFSSAADTFFDKLRDFMASSGDPAMYENALTPDGIKAAQAAAAATAAAHTGHLSPDASAAIGVEAAEALDTPGDTVSSTGSAAGSTDSAFAAEAAMPKLPLLGSAGVSRGGVVMCPGVPNTAALGVKGGLTKVVPAELHLPKQHAALFSTEQQRTLLHRGSDALRDTLKAKLLPTMQLWLDTFEECKVERLRTAADKARGNLDAAMAAVVQAEASHPLTSPEALTQAGMAVPRVLVRGSEGTMLTQHVAGGVESAAAGAGAAGGGDGGADVLVAVPAVKEREEMYKREQEETDATLSFELAEKVLRDRLRWLVTAGAGLKALLTSALAHSLRAAADMGEVGQAAGGTTVGQLRAPEEELLTPFPQHVLARLKGEHLPTLPDLVLSDQARLARWCERYKAAMAAEAAATAAAAGAQMMAAAAARTPDAASAVSPTAGVGPAGANMFRTDEGSQGGAAAGTAAVLTQDTGAAKTASGRDSASVEAPAGPDMPQAGDTETTVASDQAPEDAAVAAGSGKAQGGGASSGMGAQLQRVAAESGLPLDLLAAAVAADVQEQEAAAAKATKGDIAWRLLHDASITVGKEQAVLLPEVKKAVGGLLPTLLVDSHTRITDGLSKLSSADPATPAFDLAVLEVVDVLEQHSKVLSTEILPALFQSDSKVSLRSLAGSYRRAAASAPTRPHAWLLSTDTGNGGRGWMSAAVGAAGRAAKVPVRAGVALADAAADAAHFGPSHTPLSV